MQSAPGQVNPLAQFMGLALNAMLTLAASDQADLAQNSLAWSRC